LVETLCYSVGFRILNIYFFVGLVFGASINQKGVWHWVYYTNILIQNIAFRHNGACISGSSNVKMNYFQITFVVLTFCHFISTEVLIFFTYVNN